MNLSDTKINVNELIKNIKEEKFVERTCSFIIGVYLAAISFNVFFSPYNVINGGATGAALIFRELFGISTSDFIVGSSIVLLFISIFLLGFKRTLKSIVGIFLFAIFLKITEPFASFLNLGDMSLLVIVLFGSCLTGFANGLIFKAGYSSSGFQNLYLILNKYLHISVGSSSRVTNIIILLCGLFVFGVSNILYAIISLVITTIVTDKVMLGISGQKTFYVVTTKEKEMKEFIDKKIKHSCTMIDAKGGYSGSKKKMLMCVIPNGEYLFFKEVVSEIDKKAYFIATDSYEIIGGK